MSDDGLDNDGNARYYATKTEQQWLIWGLRRYFSFPERSSNRNQIAAQVTEYLKNFSPHWTHRAVRLWFNNNKKTFFNDSGFPLMGMASIVQRPMQMQPQMMYQMQAMQAPVMKQPNPQQPQAQAPLQQNQQIPPAQQPIQPVPQQAPPPQQIPPPQPAQQQIPQNSQNQSVPKVHNPSPKAPSPVQHPQNTSQILQMQQPIPQVQVSSPQSQPSQKASTPIALSPVPQQSTPPQNHPQKVLLPPIRPPPPKVHFNSPNLVRTPSNSALNEYQPPKPKNIYSNLSQIMKQIRSYNSNETDKLSSLCEQYDSEVRKIVSSEGLCSPEKIACGMPFVHIRSGLPDQSMEDIVTETPSDFSLSHRTLSILDPESYLASPNVSTTNIPQADTPMRVLYQERRFNQIRVGTYDSITITNSFACYVYSDLMSPAKLMAVSDVTNPKLNFVSFTLPSALTIEALCISENKSAWCFDGNKVMRVPFRNNPVQSFTVDTSGAVGSPILVPIEGTPHTALAFSQSDSLYNLIYDGSKVNTKKIQMPYRGISALMSSGTSFFTSPADSFSIRQISNEGKEIGSFIGHTSIVRELMKRTSTEFVSRADDETVRLWDIRTPVPSITLNCQATCISGDKNYVVCGMNNKGISVFDVRDSRQALYVPTQEYLAEAICYDGENDVTTMFGLISRDIGKDSMIFIDTCLLYTSPSPRD